MKKLFPGYTKKTEKELKKIWDNGIIYFDANVLLNLYCYSDDTREALMDLIKKLNAKIFLPHQAALEYHRNRFDVITEQEKSYIEFNKKLTRIETDLQSKNKPPFLSEKIHDSLKKILTSVKEELSKGKEKYTSYLEKDTIYQTLSTIFHSKITDAYDEKRLNKIYNEGKTRFDKRQPPGYEDRKKPHEGKYGDLVLWNQIIDKAIETKKPVILITDDGKKDWWWKIKEDRNMGPRPELVEEMMKKAKVEFHMYSSEKFLSYGLSYLKEQQNKEALNEIKERMKDSYDKSVNHAFSDFINTHKKLEISRISEISSLKGKIQEIEKDIESTKRLIYSQDLDVSDNAIIQGERAIDKMVLEKILFEEQLSKLFRNNKEHEIDFGFD